MTPGTMAALAAEVDTSAENPRRLYAVTNPRDLVGGSSATTHCHAAPAELTRECQSDHRRSSLTPAACTAIVPLDKLFHVRVACSATTDLDGQADSPQIPTSEAEKDNGDDQHDDQGYQHGGHTDSRPTSASTHLLRAELARPGYVCDPIALGSNTDPYQPIEREWKVTRSILEVLTQCEHPFSIVTKSSRVERDIDLIAPMAAKSMARVYVSITTLDHDLARKLEPRATAPARRLQTIKTLAEAGIPVGVLVAPVIPQLNDRNLEAILEAAAANGARHAGWIMLRLPREVAPLFRA